MKFPSWNVAIWLVIIGAFAVFELIGVFSGKLATLTDLIRQWLPIWVRAMILGWLTWHFLMSPDNWINSLKDYLR